MSLADYSHSTIYWFKAISHYEEPESDNHMALLYPAELLVEVHHSNYGEPWACGRGVFEFLAQSIKLKLDSYP